MQEDQGPSWLSALGVSQRGGEALARAARMAEIMRNQSHDDLWHKAEQMNPGRGEDWDTDSEKDRLSPGPGRGPAHLSLWLQLSSPISHSA